MACFLDVPVVTGWTKAQVILQAIAAIGAIAALLYSLKNFTKTLRDSYYIQLDKMYFDLLKLIVERPYLIAPAETRKDDEGKQGEYEAYAFMVWNFIETIFDRCPGNAHLCETWYPIIETENLLHRKWFDEARNRSKFKTKFVDFIVQEKYKNAK
jgi:hypothetical protein